MVKRRKKVQESFYEVFGGATVTRIGDGYEIAWKSAHPMSIKVSSPPEIDDDIETKKEGETIRILSQECKLKIVIKDGEMKAFFSKL